MNRTTQPVLIIRHDGSQRTFAAGHDVVIGRDRRADVPIADPRISRRHLILRFDQDRWVAIDNGSVNGTFLNGYRMPVIDIHDGQSVNVGNPEGPMLTFEVGRDLRGACQPPRASPVAEGRPPTISWPSYPPPTQSRSQTARHTANGSASGSGAALSSMTRSRPRAPLPQPAPDEATGPPPAAMTVVDTASADVGHLANRMVRFFSQRPTTTADAVTIGRANDNDIIVSDVLASRRHATVVATPLGTEIRDRSINGTFVNGVRVGSACLTEGDVVTVGNVDLVFSNGTLVKRTEAATRTGGLEVRGVTLNGDGGRRLLNDISLIARPGTLTAIIGGSGAGKTTLAKLIAGHARPGSGSVTFEGHDMHAEYASLRSRIGMVPQDDVVHRQLTVRQALHYAAELRLPPDTGDADRSSVVDRVLAELDLTGHARTRVDRLPGGQRKRASVALELLTGPSLLILDEPTSGLDPALDHQVMTLLRRLADAGRVVIVVTHMLSYLDVCDQLLLVAPGGKTAFCGPPDQIGLAMGTTNWSEIFSKVGADPEEANRRFLGRAQAGNQPHPAAGNPAEPGEPVHTSAWRQVCTIARRQLRLVVADRAYFVFLALLPFILGALSLAVPGSNGFHLPGPRSGTPDESAQILNLLVLAAAFMGTALTIRDLVGERAVFRREQAAGLSMTAYLSAKTAVFCGFAILQSAIATAIVIVGKGAPARGAVLPGHPAFELFTTVAATCVASAMLGLALSALVRSSEQIMPLFVVSIMAQWVLCGGLVPVTDRTVLDQLSWVTPAHWGYAAAASTVDLRSLVPDSLLPQDRFWAHTSDVWLFDMAMLAALSVFYAGFVRWKIRLRR